MDIFGGPGGFDPIAEIFGDIEEESKQDEPYTIEEAKNILYNENGLIPTAAEVNDWLYENNAPWVRVGNYYDRGLPGYNQMAQEDYYNQSNYSMESYSGLMLLLATTAGAIYLGRRFRRNQTDDDDEYKP